MMDNMTRLPSNAGDRKYTAPTSGDHYQPGRRKDDLHEWSIYRQNLTSSIAESLLGNAGPVQPPFGDFQMHDHTVESVINYARNEDYLLGDKGDIYLRFGLPRVALPTQEGGVALYQQGNFKHGSRKATSEGDLRRAVLEAQTSRGPYVTSNGTSPLTPISGVSVVPPGRRFQSVDQGLDILTSELPSASTRSGIGIGYAQSDLGGTRQQQDVFNIEDFQRGSDLLAPKAPRVNNLVDPFENNLNGSIYWQSKRHHHNHYFSNIDLFVPQTAAFNYLRYAKAEDLQPNINKQPHLILKNVSYDIDRRSTFDVFMLRSPKYAKMLDHVTMELYGGETVALMHTSNREVRALFSLMTDMHSMRGRLDGAFYVNGLRLKPKNLRDRVAYVCTDEISSQNLTVEEYLKFMSAVALPATNAFRTESMINQLIQTLALAPFAARCIGKLGRTEKQRVKVAAQILLDTDIILLEDICAQMDLYDTAFLIDYLRDWASKLNRIVIMAINPPSFEILAMFYKAAILASGRIIYCGKSQKMLEYFEALSYPCPLFKNPCDYYIDLVTHDYLTVEASFESAERIKRLADVWLQKSIALPEPGPPGVPPPKVRRINACTAIFWLYGRFWLMLLNDPWLCVSEVAYATLMGVLLGTTFYSLRTDWEAGVNDRFGLFYVLLILFHLPNLFLNIERVCKERSLLWYDRRHRLYSPISFYAAKVLFDFPLALIAYLCYVIPVYFMAKLRSPGSANGALVFGTYLGVVILHCMALRMLAWLCAYMMPRKFYALALLGFFLTLFSLSAGVTLPGHNIWHAFQWFRYASPTRWAVQILAQHEFVGDVHLAYDDPLLSQQGALSNATFSARPGSSASQVQPLKLKCGIQRIRNHQHKDLVTLQKLACPVETGDAAMRFALEKETKTEQLYYVGIPVIAAWGLAAFLLNCCCVAVAKYEPKRRIRHRSD